MSNKNFHHLTAIDKALRKRFPVGMRDAVDCTITIQKRTGFEQFNTRPYHNYENWSDGYYIKYEDDKCEIHARGEDFDDAIADLERKLTNPRPYEVRMKEVANG